MHSAYRLEKSYLYQATAGMLAVQLGSGMNLIIHYNIDQILRPRKPEKSLTIYFDDMLLHRLLSTDTEHSG